MRFLPSGYFQQKLEMITEQISGAKGQWYRHAVWFVQEVKESYKGISDMVIVAVVYGDWNGAWDGHFCGVSGRGVILLPK